MATELKQQMLIFHVNVAKTMEDSFGYTCQTIFWNNRSYIHYVNIRNSLRTQPLVQPCSSGEHICRMDLQTLQGRTGKTLHICIVYSLQIALLRWCGCDLISADYIRIAVLKWKSYLNFKWKQFQLMRVFNAVEIQISESELWKYLGDYITDDKKDKTSVVEFL